MNLSSFSPFHTVESILFTYVLQISKFHMWNKFCLQVEKREAEQAVDRLYARNLIKNNCTKLSMPQNLCIF